MGYFVLKHDAITVSRDRESVPIHNADFFRRLVLKVDEIIQAFNYVEGNACMGISAQFMSTKRVKWKHLQKLFSDHLGNISVATWVMRMHRISLQRKLAKNQPGDRCPHVPQS